MQAWGRVYSVDAQKVHSDNAHWLEHRFGELRSKHANKAAVAIALASEEMVLSLMVHCNHPGGSTVNKTQMTEFLREAVSGDHQMERRLVLRDMMRLLDIADTLTANRRTEGAPNDDARKYHDEALARYRVLAIRIKTIC